MAGNEFFVLHSGVACRTQTAIVVWMGLRDRVCTNADLACLGDRSDWRERNVELGGASDYRGLRAVGRIVPRVLPRQEVEQPNAKFVNRVLLVLCCLTARAKASNAGVARVIVKT